MMYTIYAHNVRVIRLEKAQKYKFPPLSGGGNLNKGMGCRAGMQILIGFSVHSRAPHSENAASAFVALLSEFPLSLQLPPPPLLPKT